MEEAIHMEIESAERVWFKLLETPKESEQKTIRPDRGFFDDGMSLGQVFFRPQFQTRCFFCWTITNFYQFMYLLVVPRFQDYTTGMFSQAYEEIEQTSVVHLVLLRPLRGWLQSNLICG